MPLRAHNPALRDRWSRRAGSSPRNPALRGSVPQSGTQPVLFLAMSRVSGRPYFLYILWSAQGKRFYIGVSSQKQNGQLFASWP